MALITAAFPEHREGSLSKILLMTAGSAFASTCKLGETPAAPAFASAGLSHTISPVATTY